MTARTILDAIKVYEDEPSSPSAAISTPTSGNRLRGSAEPASRVAELHPELGASKPTRVWGVLGVVGTLQRAKARPTRSGGHSGPIWTRSTSMRRRIFPIAPTVPGKMHACGHDGHTTMLLGAARYLAENPDFGGTVHFFFQPAEEGLGGAQAMIEDGLFEPWFPVDAVYGMHNKPGWPVGEFGLRASARRFQASDTLTVTFKGSGGHGGSGAHKSTDPTLPLGHFILAVQAIIGRNIPAVEPAVLSIGHISAGAFGAPGASFLPR